MTPGPREPAADLARRGLWLRTGNQQRQRQERGDANSSGGTSAAHSFQRVKATFLRLESEYSGRAWLDASETPTFWLTLIMQYDFVR